MLSGQRAFPLREPATDTLEDLRQARHIPLAQQRSDLPLALSDLVERCLALDPSDRPDSAQSLAEALQKAQTPCGPEGLAEFLRQRAEILGQDRALVPDPTEVAQHPITDGRAPSTRRWKATLVFLFLLCWGAGLAWLIANPAPAAEPRPPTADKPQAPTGLLARPLTVTKAAEPAPPARPAPEEIKKHSATSIPAPHRPAPVVAVPRPQPSDLEQAQLRWPEHMRAWVNHQAISGQQVQLRPGAAQLIRLQGREGGGPEVTLRLSPPGGQSPVWRMSLRAQPWMRISIDGRPVGQTPRSGLKLSYGMRKLVLERNGDKLLFDFRLPAPSKGTKG